LSAFTSTRNSSDTVLAEKEKEYVEACRAIAVLAFDLFGDGLRDILDPRLADK